jgi:hypothetical protein
VEINERSNTPGGWDNLKIQDAIQKCECENTSDTTDSNHQKDPEDSLWPGTVISLWTTTNKY